MPRTLFISTGCRAGLFRRLAGMCAAFMLVLQVAFPGAGQAAAGGEWIEICGEFGVVEMQVAGEDSEDTQDCPKCSTCALCAAESGAGPVSVLRSGLSRAAECAVLLPAGTAVRPNPAQYWHDGRGPPLANKIEPERALGASMAATQNKGEAPWS
ncbi:hypothetical protein PHA8399_03913 [Leisingera aquaemixtae]|uniref:4Fe-4S ferredoxin-type domain-containing protein n=2 Tax=Leisingera aquaemixtae TaxID=1396826 RepID=A0A0P1HE53_9RHOB|nr:hypothetical protein PHA8399_03913 [Leisingera aquaemixtae]